MTVRHATLNVFKKFGPGLALTVAICGAPQAQADIIVDNFTTASAQIFQPTPGTETSTPVSGAGILGSRTISVTSESPLTAGFASAGVSVGTAQGSFLGAYPTPNAGSNFTLAESFSSTNALALGLSSIAFNLASTTGVTVEIIANGTSTDTVTFAPAVHGASVSFSFASFSDPSVFSHLTSLTFVETFPNSSQSGPSVGFDSPVLLTGAGVPEPSSFVLSGLAMGVSSLMFWNKRRVARKTA